MMHAILDGLLGEGFNRVFAESHKYNVPSVRSFLRVGFRAVASITVVAVPGEGEYVRWLSPGVTQSHLRVLDLPLDAVIE
jgi:RimJ/RimL family protein N-acetyltransferase